MTAEVQQMAMFSTTAAAATTSPSPVNPVQIPGTMSRSESPPSIITVRMIMQGKEVGSIIGKKGDNVKRYREESGAKINISDASCPERIVTTTGSVDQIHKAFEMISAKFEEDLQAQAGPEGALPPVNVRLVIPASQCGSLIGKGGTKIKDIRETTGASVQVASEMLPNSTERAVTITGPSPSITRCIHDICNVMLESPPKGATIPYRPKPALQAPIMYAAAAGAQAAYAMPTTQPQLQIPPQTIGSPTTTGATTPTQQIPAEQQKIAQPVGGMAIPSSSTGSAYVPQSLPHYQLAAHMATQGTPLILPQPGATYGSYYPGLSMGGMNQYMAAAAAPRTLNSNLLAASMGAPQQTQSTEMTIPNELIGCIIGRGGAKINEIRQVSGAQIKISNCEEGTNDRKVTITGFPDTISMATYLINTSMELHKSQLLNSDPNAMTSTSATQQATQPIAAPAAMVPAAAQMYSKQHAAAMMPYAQAAAFNPAAYGLGMSNPMGLAMAAYDPKAILSAANKLKILPTATGMKRDAHRYAPY